jgi:hypothetical protein
MGQRTSEPLAGAWTVREQNRLLAFCFGFPEAKKA